MSQEFDPKKSLSLAIEKGGYCDLQEPAAANPEPEITALEQRNYIIIGDPRAETPVEQQGTYLKFKRPLYQFRSSFPLNGIRLTTDQDYLNWQGIRQINVLITDDKGEKVLAADRQFEWEKVAGIQLIRLGIEEEIVEIAKEDLILPGEKKEKRNLKNDLLNKIFLNRGEEAKAETKGLFLPGEEFEQTIEAKIDRLLDDLGRLSPEQRQRLDKILPILDKVDDRIEKIWAKKGIKAGTATTITLLPLIYGIINGDLPVPNVPLPGSFEAVEILLLECLAMALSFRIISGDVSEVDVDTQRRLASGELTIPQFSMTAKEELNQLLEASKTRVLSGGPLKYPEFKEIPPPRKLAVSKPEVKEQPESRLKKLLSRLLEPLTSNITEFRAYADAFPLADLRERTAGLTDSLRALTERFNDPYQDFMVKRAQSAQAARQDLEIFYQKGIKPLLKEIRGDKSLMEILDAIADWPADQLDAVNQAVKSKLAAKLKPRKPETTETLETKGLFLPGEELIKAKDKQDKKLEEITLINLITLALVTSLLAVKKNSPDVPLPGSWQTWPHFLSSLIYLIYVELILMRNLERSRGDQEFDSLALHRQLVKGQLVFPSLPEKPAEPALAVEDEEVKPEPIIDEAEKAALPPAKTKLTDKIKRRKRKK